MDEPAAWSFCSISSSTCFVCSSMVPLKCAPTPERKTRLPNVTIAEYGGGVAGAGVDAAGADAGGFHGIDFFFADWPPCAAACGRITAAPAVPTATAATFFNTFLRDCFSIYSLSCVQASL